MSSLYNTLFAAYSTLKGNSYNEKHEPVVVIVTLLLSAFALLIWLMQKSNKENSFLPPGPRGWPLVGYLPYLGSNLHDDFSELAKIYGPIYKVWLGQRLGIVISSAALVKEVVRDEDVVFANHDPTSSAKIVSSGVFRAYSDEWKKLRKVFVHEMLSKSVLDNLYGLRRSMIHKSIKDVYRKIGTPIDNFRDVASSTIFNVVISMIWGESISVQGGASNDNVLKFRKLTGELLILMGKANISDAIPSLARFDIQGIQRQTKKAASEIESILDSAIYSIKSNNTSVTNTTKTENKGLLQILMDLIIQQQDGGLSITTSQLKALLIDVILAGTDTSITTIEWVMVKLLQNPDVMSKVHEELEEVVGLNNMVEESHLPKLKYLDAVIRETFRLQPPVPLLVPRCPTKTVKIGGYIVPKGSSVFLHMGVIQRDPSIWEDPLEFKPQRFLEGGQFDYTGNNFSYLPFGSGRRICAGLSLVEKILPHVLASLLHSFNWKLPFGTQLDLLDKFGIVTKKAEPIPVIPTSRLTNLELYT